MSSKRSDWLLLFFQFLRGQSADWLTRGGRVSATTQLRARAPYAKEIQCDAQRFVLM
jgi:hypothetical protein